MRATPCLGDWYFYTFQKNSWQPWANTWQVRHPRLQKKSNYLFECPGVNVIRISVLDCYRNNQTYYFAECYPVDPAQPFSLEPTIIYPGQKPPFCAYLGRYPLYWDFGLHGLTMAHNTQLTPRFAIGMKGFLPGVSMDQFLAFDRETLKFYYSKEQLDEWAAQQAILKYRATWLTQCNSTHYDPEPFTPKINISTPFAPATFDDTPITELTLPLPDQAPTDPAKIAMTMAPTLTLWYWQDLNELWMEIEKTK